jgi:acyl-coenzyme A thioesterase PaaI-like protein
MARPRELDIPEIEHCFGCGPKNPQGLHLEAQQEGALTVADFQGHQGLAGWDNMVHGGLVATILDEVAAFAMLRHCRQYGMTRTMTVQYRRRTRWDLPLRAEAELKQRDGDRAMFTARIVQEGQVTVEGEVEFRLMAMPRRPPTT